MRLVVWNANMAVHRKLDIVVELNRPGNVGGSLPWKRGWSYAEGKIAG